MIKSEEIAHIRHQIRNQVNNITINAELAKLQLETQAGDEHVLISLQRILDHCNSCAIYLNSLTEDDKQSCSMPRSQE